MSSHGTRLTSAAARMMALTALLACGAPGIAAQENGCETGVLGSEAETLTASGYSLTYRADPAPIESGVPFALDIHLCAEAGRPQADAITVEFGSPDRGENASLAFTARGRGGGHFRAEGFFADAPGRWRLTFEVRTNSASHSLANEIVLP